jgi:uncharacterized protein
MDANTFHFFSIKGKNFIYNVNTTLCAELDDVALTIIPEILDNDTKGINEKYGHLYSKSDIQECLNDAEILFNNKDAELTLSNKKHTIQHDVASICLHISHDCNLNCKYCYAKGGTYGGKRALMDQETMIKAIDFAFSHSGNIKVLNIGFFGGEPLINFPRIIEAVKYSKENAIKFDKHVAFSMTSNGVSLNPEIMKFISEEYFSLIFSIDGPEEIHDKMRVTRNGTKSHSIILNNILKYMNDYSSDFTVRGTFTRITPNFSQQVLFLNDQGFRSISVEPAILNADHPYSISSEGTISRILFEYNHLADIYLERFKNGNPIHFFHFDNNIKKLLQPQPIVTECGAGGALISVIPDGRIFPCFETALEDKNCIGNLDSGFNPVKRSLFQHMNVNEKDECRRCWIRYTCGGGCHGFNIRFNDDINIPYKPQCYFIKYRYKLSAWILSEVMALGEEAVVKIKNHVLHRTNNNLESNRDC